MASYLFLIHSSFADALSSQNQRNLDIDIVSIFRTWRKKGIQLLWKVLCRRLILKPPLF